MVNYFKPSPKSSVINKKLKVAINRLDLNGCGVGSYKGKSIFIEGALPNEDVVVSVTEQKNKYIRGKLLEVLKASDSRINPKCQHYAQCGGCDLQHLAANQHLDFKQKKVSDLFSRNHIKEALPWQNAIVDSSWHYRRKARIGVQYNKRGEAIIGFRKKASNTLIPIKDCLVLASPLNSIFTPLNEIIPLLSGHNAIGHIEVIQTKVNTLIIRQLVELTAKDKELWRVFSENNQYQIMIDNGKTVTPLFSKELLTYNIDSNIELTFTAGDFIQVNHAVNQKMIAQALDWLTLNDDDVVLDLFCGLGNFSLPLAKRVTKVVGIEGVINMVEQASENAKSNNTTNATFYQADLNSPWHKHEWCDEKYSKVLLDPARAGAYEAIEQLVKFNIGTVLYVSCDPSTLAKDAALLLKHGYQIKKISLIDMFSQTKHIETMVLFQK